MKKKDINSALNEMYEEVDEMFMSTTEPIKGLLDYVKEEEAYIRNRMRTMMIIVGQYEHYPDLRRALSVIKEQYHEYVKRIK
jgi:hypothetical protein